ncbi:hypothetical protein E1B28_001240 [Marasmius oreades]|uniref:Uncharacterized protein n=1 Tax=Marasmius oreades TaxID=181124 RepID=A0A9P7V2Z3_9AGAR|nr:uncharacterized protein E1B28_001240 [Marasmius oreades]KAG7099385.1 hypothetical protein E1B28_001240 [Marasmius oreades]
MSLSSPEPPFMPRPEFIRHHKSPPSSFALLTFSGPNCIRLYSFSLEVIATLRRFLDQRVIVQGIREDADNNLYEFALDGKPWSSPKNLATERFLVNLLAVLYHCGYNYQSTIDYGREPDDRLAITFSCPVIPSDAPLTHTPTPQGSGSILSEKQKFYRVPFALSFPSSTILRVINPPLHSTPAILQAVRSSWPRGVESEKKVGDNCFEFKLKGYKWFQEDTFAADSLRHILSLLSSLDAHSFTLQTSLSLTSRSRVKDLWIFTGPPSSVLDDAPLPDSASHSLSSSSQTALRCKMPTPETVATNSHKKLVTEPLLETIPLSPSQAPHQRAMTDQPNCGDLSPWTATPPSPHSPSPSVSNLLRKAAPRAQVPVSVHDGDPPNGTEYRAVLPSVIPEGVPDMTGIGTTPDVLYSTSPFGVAEVEKQPSSLHHRIQTPPLHSPPKTPPLATSPSPTHTSSPSRNASPSSPPDHEREGNLNPDPEHNLDGPLLSPGTFRDSAFSSSTEMSKEIPIKWTGRDLEALNTGDKRPSQPDRMSSVGPILPGGWQPSPVEEKEMTPRSPEPEIKDTEEHLELKQNVRVASPEFNDPPEQQLRRSEAAWMGVISPNDQPALPPLESDISRGKQRQESSGSSTGQGWVLVNVEGKGSAISPTTETSKDAVGVSPGSQSSSSPYIPGPEVDGGHVKQPTSANASMSPAAKTIVIIDAVDGKKSKQTKESPSASRVRRFFSLSRKDSPKLAEKLAQNGPSSSGTETVRNRSRSAFGQRLRRIGTPEATRNEENRRSFD